MTTNSRSFTARRNEATGYTTVREAGARSLFVNRNWNADDFAGWVAHVRSNGHKVVVLSR